MRYANLYTFLEDRIAANRERTVFYSLQQGIWRGIPWRDFYQETYNFACALKAFGVARQKAVCVLMGNNLQWAIADLGTILAGGVSVGIYPTSSPEQCCFIINHSDAEFVLVDTAERLNKVLEIQASLPAVKKIIVLDDTSRGIISYQDFVKTGAKNRERFEPEIRAEAANASADETAIMVYTSGTTGVPKGVCLSHRYILNSAESVVETLGLQDTDTAFSYLPFCHVAERIAGFYTRLLAGMTTYFIQDITKLYSYMLEIKPTIFGSLPRFFEKIHARIITDVELVSAEEHAAFYEALEIGRQVSRLKQANQAVPEELRKQYAQVLPILSERVKAYAGGNIRMMTSGGAPLPLEIGEFFFAAGIPILEAYGLTENVCVAFNRPANPHFGTVGPAMVGCEIKIDDDGEILVRSDMMFSGYYKEPEKTSEMFRDGWLMTGDLGVLDEAGFLKITGRKKELIITSTGKNVAPLLLENMLKEHPLISQAMVYGDGKSYLVALITLNQIEIEEYARAKGISYENYAALTQDDEIKSLIARQVADVNARVSSTEAIKRFAIPDRDFSVEEDEITPTMKIKRNVIAINYTKLLENLYV